MGSSGQSRLSSSSLEMDLEGLGLVRSHMLLPRASLIIALVLPGEPRPGMETRAAVRRSENGALQGHTTVSVRYESYLQNLWTSEPMD